MLDPVQRTIARFKYYPDVLLIQNNISNRNKFSFSAASKSDVKKELKNSSLKKVTTKNNFPPRIWKESDKVSSNILKKLVNDAIISGKFPDNLKLADVTPVFKKKNSLDKINNGPVCVFTTASRIFEKLMEKQLNHFI